MAIKNWGEGPWGETLWGGETLPVGIIPAKPLRCALRILNSVKQNTQRVSQQGSGRCDGEPCVSPKHGFLEYNRFVPTDENAMVDATDTLISKEHRPGRSPYL